MPYIINFCNLTQVKKDTGFVRSIRRVQQAAYPAAMRNEVPPGIDYDIKLASFASN